MVVFDKLSDTSVPQAFRAQYNSSRLPGSQAGFPLKIHQHSPITREEDWEQPFCPLPAQAEQVPSVSGPPSLCFQNTD